MGSIHEFAVVSFTAEASLWTVRLSTGHQPIMRATPTAVHVKNAFCVTRHPDLDLLYLAALDDKAEVIALRQRSDADFTIVHRASVVGASGICRLQVDPSGRYLAVAGYSSGTVSTLSLDADGLFDGDERIAHFSGSEPDPERQNHAYIHDVLSNELEILAADLGADQVRTIALDGAEMREQSTLACPPGSGPRHVATVGDGLIAISGELDSTLMLARLHGGPAAILDAVPATSRSTATRNYPSAVVADPDRSLVYLANRGADTILTASVDRARGTLTVVAETPSGGTRPEQVALIEGHLLVAHSDDGTVSALRLDEGVPSGRVAASVTIPGAIWIESLGTPSRQ